jgi:hypothetical protein
MNVTNMLASIEPSSVMIVIAIICQTIVMIVFLMLSTRKIEIQTTKLADKFNTIVLTINELRTAIQHHEKTIHDHEARIRTSEKSTQRIEIQK